MMYRVLLAFALSIVANLCVAKTYSYTRDIQPIFTRNCVSCHACYDSPCQLNLGSAQGLERGASKALVYDGARTRVEPTTRLFFDSSTTQGWRDKGFYSVTENRAGQVALLAQFISLGHANDFAPNSKLPDHLDVGINRINQCPKPDEFAQFAKEHPQSGMPYAVTGMTPEDYQTVQLWLAQGAPIDTVAVEPRAAEARQIEQWEAFFNQPGARENLVNRWLFEHLFLAHLYFEGENSGHFFQLVRSRTPSGQPVDPIVTRRPNDDPGIQYFYRFWQIPDVIVHKTHITYPLSQAKMERINSLFYATDWTVDSVPGYGAQRRANPFETFAQVPAQARYQFMLDNAEYFVRTFIRGPVCRGQIATDVIRDNFWAVFQAPQHDLYITDPDYREQATPLLAMPGQFDEIGDLFGLWRRYRDKRNAYESLRRDVYADAAAPTWDSIWKGNDNALLSIFRQHDSASVRKGLVGEIPQTLWLMDYPLLERTYYQLVVNFDVYGNLSHQAQTRLYFDLIRNGAEQNFLRLLPSDTRKDYLHDWYQNSGKVKLWLDYEKMDYSSESALDLPKQGAKDAFANQLLRRFDDLNVRPDPINRCQSAFCYRRDVDPAWQNAEQLLSRLASRPAASLRLIDWMPEATMLRVEKEDGAREIYSVLRNRAHSNVAFMMGEDRRYQPGLDTLTIYPGIFSSYPNFIFNIPANEMETFVERLETVSSQSDFEAVVERWGIRRTHPRFWFYFHDLKTYLDEKEPLEAGVLDMNRYENL